MKKYTYTEESLHHNEIIEEEISTYKLPDWWRFAMIALDFKEKYGSDNLFHLLTACQKTGQDPGKHFKDFIDLNNIKL